MKVRPFHIVVIIGVLLGVLVAVSGIAPVLTEWHDESTVAREVFGNIPGVVEAHLLHDAARSCSSSPPTCSPRG